MFTVLVLVDNTDRLLLILIEIAVYAPLPPSGKIALTK